MTTYAVTGASGHLGELAINGLLARGVTPADIVAVVRTPSRAASLADRGVQVRAGDYARAETLPAALDGVDRLLLVSSSEQGQRVAQHTNVIQAAQSAGTSRIVYTSILNADTSTNPLAGEHRDTERAIRESGLPWVMLRNGWYAENYTYELGQYLASGELVGCAGGGRISSAARRDYADAAAAALLGDETADRVYELGGRALDLAQIAQVVTEVSGTPVRYRDLTVEAYVAEQRRAGVDEATSRFVAALDESIANGDLETDSDDLVQLIGRPATPMFEVIADAYAALRRSERQSRDEE